MKDIFMNNKESNLYIVDSHCHLNVIDKPFEQYLNEDDIKNIAIIIEDAKKNDVKKIINVGTSFIESKNCITIANRFKDVYASIAIHPNDLNNNWQDELNQLENEIKKNKKILAIGECGLDKHYKNYNINKQSKAFIKHIEIALSNQLPLIIHTRDAEKETLDILNIFKSDFIKQNNPGIIHCFSGDMPFALKAIELGFYLGIGGTLTYPKNHILQDVAKNIPIDKIILETDSPFLPPQNLRGQKNYPKNIIFVAQKLAEIKGILLDNVILETTKNCKTIFKFK